MVRIDVAYRGGLRCDAVHEPSGATLHSDAPKDNHGRGESFSPTDLVATALGTCMLTLMGILAERRGWDLTGTTASVEKVMVADPVRRIGKLIATIRLNRDFPPADRKVLEAAALTCPVHKSIHPDIEAPVTFVYPDAAR
jgi:putative redox protein